MAQMQQSSSTDQFAGSEGGSSTLPIRRSWPRPTHHSSGHRHTHTHTRRHLDDHCDVRPALEGYDGDRVHLDELTRLRPHADVQLRGATDKTRIIQSELWGVVTARFDSLHASQTRLGFMT